jgi:hypothetical protein
MLKGTPLKTNSVSGFYWQFLVAANGNIEVLD